MLLDQIGILEASLRTNIAMARMMTEMMQFILARKYIELAKKDRTLLKKLKFDWTQDSTLEYKQYKVVL